MILEKYREQNKTVVVVFLDTEEAYDFYYMARKSQKIKQISHESKSCVQLQDGRSGCFQTSSGVQQGNYRQFPSLLLMMRS